MNKISFIIVNYNTKELLERCVENLLGIFPEMEVIVVDNASKDGSIELMEQKYADRARLIKSENKGLAHGNNLALDAATGHYLIFLGSDAYPTKEAIADMYDFMEKTPGVGIVTPKLVLRSGGVDWDAHRGLMTPRSTLMHFSRLNRVFWKSKFFNEYFKGYEDMNSVHEIDACISHFMLTKREVFDKVGRWDEGFFLFGEDIDFCFRVKEAGYKIMYLGNVEVLHFKGVTIRRKESSDIQTAANQNIENRRFLRRESTRAMNRFYKKHLWKKYPLAVSVLVVFGNYLLSWLRMAIFDLNYYLRKSS